ncbi:MAG: hypothetical protein KDK48_02550, partial [Chlamydiia bacterium]|nr:hypothetical protein [Chlamydiia bacterium]
MKSLLKWLLGLGILFFLGMVYWSNLLIENNLIELKSRVDALERRPFLKEAVRQEKKEALPELKNNLLSVDPFYEKTLPALLGSDFAPHGELRLAIVARPKDLHPFTPWAEAN